jgi:enoyl-CoA hydratase/carnithine racemase
MARATGYEAITLQRQGLVATITLNRPERLNAIDGRMGDDLRAAWSELDGDDDVRVIIVTGAGRGFCSGMDLVMGSEQAPAPDARTDYAKSVHLSAIHCSVWKPVLTAVNGVCAGGGLHFIADSDITICSDEASFLDPHVSVGQVSALEPIGLLRRVPFETVMRMALMGKGERLSAADALRWGLVSEVVEPGQLLARAAEIAEAIAANSPAAVMATKRAIWQSLDQGLHAGLANGWRILQEHYTHPDVQEGPRAFAERRQPRWASPSARRSLPEDEPQSAAGAER